ncbi:MAG: hemerythrin domain-containing protein [Gammaproteobacteria bacterium]|nr:hemerythrin domain-containing protein [Gammaproteobacteria bacterium]
MAKRHPALIPVAREHHECLILAQRLMRGARVPDGDWPRDPVQQAAMLAEFFKRHLRQHFAIEEALVFPAACSAGSEAGALVLQLLDEHRDMESRVEQLAANPQVMATELAAFGELLNAHIRLEDRQLFPLMEAGMSADALLELQRRIESHYGDGQGLVRF